MLSLFGILILRLTTHVMVLVQTHLHILDWGFTIFHLLFTLFCVFGWIFKKTRILNLVTVLITGFSWFGLGIWYGFGFCPLTSWHWKVLRKLEVSPLPDSYIKFLIDRLFNTDINEIFIDNMVLMVFFGAFSASVIYNLKDYNNKLKQKEKQQP